MTTKQLSSILWAAVSLVVVVVVVHLVSANNLKKGKIVAGEELLCVTSICLEDSTATECTTLSGPIMTHIQYIEDAEGVRIIVSPTTKACK